MECPFCHERDQENLPTFHYPGLKGSTHIECQTCGQEFSKKDADHAAEVTSAVALVKSIRRDLRRK